MTKHQAMTKTDYRWALTWQDTAVMVTLSRTNATSLQVTQPDSSALSNCIEGPVSCPLKLRVVSTLYTKNSWRNTIWAQYILIRALPLRSLQTNDDEHIDWLLKTWWQAVHKRNSQKISPSPAKTSICWVINRRKYLSHRWKRPCLWNR